MELIRAYLAAHPNETASLWILIGFVMLFLAVLKFARWFGTHCDNAWDDDDNVPKFTESELRAFGERPPKLRDHPVDASDRELFI